MDRYHMEQCADDANSIDGVSDEYRHQRYNDWVEQGAGTMIATGSRFIRKYQVLGLGEFTDEIEVTHISRSAWTNSRMVHVRPVNKGFGGGREGMTMAAAIQRIQSGKWTPTA
jgi:hypothetical protein